jgi:sugar phosphate isomerase/epimerase
MSDEARRELLRLCAVLALAPALPKGAVAEDDAGPLIHGKPVGLQLYSLRQRMPQDVPGTLALIRSLGFREIEGGSDYGLGTAGFLSNVKQAGLRMTSALYDYDKDWSRDAAATVKRATDLGVLYTGLAWIPHKDVFTREDCLRAAENFNRWGAAARAAGLRFVYHVHGYEFEASPEGTLFDTLAQQTDPALVGFEADIFWVRRGGCDPVSLFEKYPGRIPLTHVKDIQKGLEVCKPNGHAPDEASVPIGAGMIDWPSVFRAAEKAGVERHFIEDEHKDAARQLPLSLAYLAQFR